MSTNPKEAYPKEAYPKEANPKEAYPKETGPKEIIVTRRITSSFLEAVPEQVAYFDAYIYAVVKRKEGLDLPGKKFGIGVRIDPATLNWKRKTITARIPLNINEGIQSIDDLDQSWFEALEASFLALIHGSLP